MICLLKYITCLNQHRTMPDDYYWEEPPEISLNLPLCSTCHKGLPLTKRPIFISPKNFLCLLKLL